MTNLHHPGTTRGEVAAGGRRRGSGIIPGIALNSSSLSNRGWRQETQGIRVQGLWNNSLTGASSTMRPMYITATRWAVSAMIPKLWVMRRKRQVIGDLELFE